MGWLDEGARIGECQGASGVRGSLVSNDVDFELEKGNGPTTKQVVKFESYFNVIVTVEGNKDDSGGLPCSELPKAKSQEFLPT